MTWFKNICFGFLAFLVFDLICSNFLLDKNKEISVEHQVFHHHFLPNHYFENETLKYGKYKIFTNSLGFRDSKIRKIDLTNKNRIIVIGDSFVEGVLLDYPYTVVGLMDNHFSQKGIEILNAGVSSYSPIIYYNKIKYFLENGLKFSHLVVFIDISDIQDELFYKYDDFSKSVKSTKILIENKNKNLKQRFLFFLKNNLTINYNIIKYFYTKTIHRYYPTEKRFFKYILSKEYDRDKWTLNEDIRLKYNKGIESSINQMQLLKNLLDKNEIKLTIVVYPWISQIYYKDLESLQVKIWKDFSKKNYINFINLFPVFINDNINNFNFYEKIKEDFIAKDVHWNRNGSKKVFKHFIKKFNY